MSRSYHQEYYGGYVPPPGSAVPPPPAPSEFQYTPAPSSAFGHAPPSHLDHYPPPSPNVINAEPPSGGHSRNPSRTRPLSHHGPIEYEINSGREYLQPAGYSDLHRSQSERGRERGKIWVEASGSRRGGSQYRPKYETPAPRKYYDEDEYYSGGSSYEDGSRAQSRAHSRSHSRTRHKRSHSRTPSWASGVSDVSYDENRSGRLIAYNKKSRDEEELNKKLKMVQEQLEKVQVDAERRRLEDKQREMEAQRNAEIERKVQEQLKLAEQKKIDDERREREAMEAEKARIAAAAKKLLEEQAAAAAAAAAAEKAEKDKIQAIIDGERRKYQSAQSGKTTYTRFSKTHLCKEALEERKVPFTEEAENFLVHRFVEKQEQEYLWARTKEIRAYYAQIQKAAENAPLSQGPDGRYVKYVQIAGQPYPLAIPVTVTQTPGGGQTHRVDAVKLSWRDLLLKR